MRDISAAKDILTCLENPPFFSARKPRHKLSAVGTPMNLQASLSKLNKHKRRDLLGCSLCCCKACTCLFKTKSGGKALVSSERWCPITDTLPRSHMTVVYGRYPDFLKIHDVLLQRKESRFIPSVNLEQSAHTSDRKSHFYCFLLLPRLEAQSAMHFSKGSLPVLIPPTCLSSVKSMALHRCHSLETMGLCRFKWGNWA